MKRTARVEFLMVQYAAYSGIHALSDCVHVVRRLVRDYRIAVTIENTPKINIRCNMKSSVKETLLTARSIYVDTINKSHFCHNCFVGWNLNILIIRNSENRSARDKNEIKTKETC